MTPPPPFPPNDPGDELAARRALRTDSISNIDSDAPKPLLDCKNCGGNWFSVHAVCLDIDRSVTGYSPPLICRDCGVESRDA